MDVDERKKSNSTKYDAVRNNTGGYMGLPVEVVTGLSVGSVRDVNSIRRYWLCKTSMNTEIKILIFKWVSES